MATLNVLIEKGKTMYGSYAALAQAVGVPASHITMWNHGKRYCSAPDRAALAVAVDEDPAGPALEAVMEGIDLSTPKGERARAALAKALTKVRKL